MSRPRIYFIQMGDGPIKIGMTKNSIESRMSALQCASPYKLKLLLLFKNFPKSYITERTIHDKFKENRLEGEWFNPTPELLDFIEYLKNIDPFIYKYEPVKMVKNPIEKISKILDIPYYRREHVI